jgi:hypothetical protein
MLNQFPADDDIAEVELEETRLKALFEADANLNPAVGVNGKANRNQKRNQQRSCSHGSAMTGPLASRTRDRWSTFAAGRSPDNPAPGIEYCLWQCDDNVCCPHGYRTADHFQIIHDDLLPYDADDGGSEITLVTQGTVNRIPMFEAQATRWPGPKVVVFAIYNHTFESHQQAALDLAKIQHACTKWVNSRVLVFTITHIPPSSSGDGGSPDKYSKKMRDPKLTLYPINALRNMVVDQARTNWIFPLDVDFIPSKTLYTRMIQVMLPRLAEVEQAAVVVPHFELLEDHATHSETPGNFSMLKDAMLRGKIVPFHSHPAWLIPTLNVTSDYDRKWPQGVADSNYSRWYYESEYGLFGMSRIRPAVNPYEYTGKFWEPFLITRRVEPNPKAVLPRYEERYVGRFRNKVEWVRTLRSKQYKFYHLLQEFCTHMPHEVLLGDANDPDAKTMKKLMFSVDDNRVREVAQTFWKNKVPRPGMYEEGWHCQL